ncbi:TPA: hypothetical protein U1C94_000754 [Streptococcus suis]|nr:hypothetical protein [Streptococcus suis]
MKNYKITSLYTKSLDNQAFAELIETSLKAVQAFSKANEKESVYALHVDRMLPLLEEYFTGLYQARSSKVSANLEEVDRNRDDAISTLKNLVKAFAKVKTPASKEAYDKLQGLLGQYKDLTSHNYEKQSGAIDHLLAELAKEEYRTALETLHLDSHVEAVKVAQTAFDAVYQDRLKEQSSKSPSKTKELRSKLLESYTFLVDFTAINAYAYPEKIAFAGLRDDLNAIRSRYQKQTAEKKKTEATK